MVHWRSGFQSWSGRDVPNQSSGCVRSRRNGTILSAGSVDTPFRVGSLTTVFAATGALVLRERGVLGLDDPLTKFLPHFSIINPFGTHQPTLRELMSHLSGLPKELCSKLYDCGGGEREDEEEIFKIIAKMELAVPPGSSVQPIYSNQATSILAHAWEVVTSPHQSCSDYLKDHVFTPLGLDSTGVDFAQVQLAPGSIYERS